MTLLVVRPISLLVTRTVALRGLWGAALRGLWRVAVLVVGGISLGAGRLGAGRLGAGRLGAGRLGAGRRAVLRALRRVATTLGALRSVAALSVMCVIATRGALRRAALLPVARSGSRLATRLTLLVTRRWRRAGRRRRGRRPPTVLSFRHWRRSPRRGLRVSRTSFAISFRVECHSSCAVETSCIRGTRRPARMVWSLVGSSSRRPPRCR